MTSLLTKDFSSLGEKTARLQRQTFSQ